ncbi:MAG: metallophosphoesterase [Leptospiraceae bacterium]|nr:metallophosphoesterase [Leptospiraceae bacterium]MDW7976182.1 metallophosphoesterase [Leptospiraceae bacterium]
MLFFYLFFSVILFILILFEYILYRRWNRRIPSSKHRFAFFLFYWILALFSNGFFVFLVLFRFNFRVEFEGLFKHLYYLSLSWNYSFFFGFFLWGILFLVFFIIYYTWQNSKFLLKFINPIFVKSQNQNSNILVNSKEILNRKTFLFTTTAIAIDTIPFIGTSSSLFGMYAGTKDFEVFTRGIPIQNLESNFNHFRIAHISDLHIGSLITEKYLTPTIEMIKTQKPDCIVVTGDILDNSKLYLSTVGWYFQKLSEIAPVYAILGNHDHIENPRYLIQTLQKARSNVLVNDFDIIQRGKNKLILIGLDYPIQHRRNNLSRLFLSELSFNEVYQKLPFKDKPIIVLNHHPGDFEYLKNKPIQLVLAGHTHGGQIILDSKKDISLLSNFMKYHVDLYHENQVYLYVNRGLGHWFPLRINCPPEITILELYKK